MPASPFLPIEPSAITEDDVDVLIAKFCATDGQARSQDDFDVWWATAQSRGWTRAECVAGMLRIMGTFTGFRIMPAHMTEAIATMSTAVGKAWNPPPPPREYRDDPIAEIRWRRAAAASYRERALLTMAAGGALESVPMIEPRLAGRPELPPAEPDSPAARAAKAAAAELEQRMAMPSGAETTTTAVRSRRAQLDPRRLEDIRAELAARPPIPLPEDEVADGPPDEAAATS